MKCDKHGEQPTICRFCDADTLATALPFPQPECEDDYAANPNYGAKSTDLVIQELLSQLTPELDIFSVVHLARRDLREGNLASAVARLRTDADKLRTMKPELVALLARL